MKKDYNKLVRDHLPEMLKEKGVNIEFEVLNNKEFSEKLVEKFREEVDEFSNTKTDRLLDQIVDLLEVIYAIAEHRGITESEVEFMRQLKKKRSGGFRKRIMVKTITESSDE